MELKPILQSSTLKSVDRRYCSCLQKVRTSQYIKNPGGYKKTKKLVRAKQVVPLGNIYNEYAVCNSSVYNGRGLKRNSMVNCSQNYDFDSFPLLSLQAYAIDKNMKLKTIRGRMLSKARLLKNIKDKMVIEKARIERGYKRIPKNMRNKSKKTKTI